MAKLSYPGYLKNRGGGTWQMTVTVGGKRHHRTIHGCTKTEAAEAITVFDAEVRAAHRASHRGIAVHQTMSKLLDDWDETVVEHKGEATRKQYRGFVGRVRYYLDHVLRSDPLVIDFAQLGVVAFLDWRRRTKFTKRGAIMERATVSDRTIQKERAALRLLLERARQLKIIQANPVDDTPTPRITKRRPILLTPAQLDALEGEMRGPMRKLYVRLMRDTAGRCGSEVLWLRWEDIDWNGGEYGYLWIWSDPEEGHTTKSSKGRWVPMTRTLRARLEAHAREFELREYEGKRSPWVLHHTRALRNAKAGSRIVGLYRSFKRAAERAGLPGDLHQHDLRHGRLTQLVKETGDLVAVQKLAGHATVRTTEGYLHLIRDDLDHLVREDVATPPAQGLDALLDHDDPAVRARAQELLAAISRSAKSEA